MFDKLQAMQKLMNDENFRAFISRPKVQVLFRDPEVSKLLLKINPRDFQV